MKDNLGQRNRFSIFCWNVANPSVQRAGKQAEWLRKRPEDILVLTETKRSEGCLLIERYFEAFGHKVIMMKPEGKEYGVMIISNHALETSSFCDSMKFLRSRVASVKLRFKGLEIEVIGTYVPSRDSSHEKTEKKKSFLDALASIFETNASSKKKVFCGDLNVLEPNHVPHYPFFEDWEYDFYQNFSKFNFVDAFRYLNPRVQEYSWIGRTGDGYRYDHCFVSADLLPFLKTCFYLHEPRERKLSDHSALITVLEIV